MVFAISALVRFCGFLMSTRLHEPESAEATTVFGEMIAPALQRQLELPISIIRNIRNILTPDQHGKRNKRESEKD
jgi:hypothetical protein